MGPSRFRFVGGHAFFIVGIQPAQGGARSVVGCVRGCVVCGFGLSAIVGVVYCIAKRGAPYQFLTEVLTSTGAITTTQPKPPPPNDARCPTASG